MQTFKLAYKCCGGCKEVRARHDENTGSISCDYWRVISAINLFPPVLLLMKTISFINLTKKTKHTGGNESVKISSIVFHRNTKAILLFTLNIV